MQGVISWEPTDEQGIMLGVEENLNKDKRQDSSTLQETVAYF